MWQLLYVALELSVAELMLPAQIRSWICVTCHVAEGGLVRKQFTHLSVCIFVKYYASVESIGVVILLRCLCLPCCDHQLTFRVYPPFSSQHRNSTLTRTMSLFSFISRFWDYKDEIRADPHSVMNWDLDLSRQHSLSLSVCVSVSLYLYFSLFQPNDHWRTPPTPPSSLKTKKNTPAPQSTLPSAMISCTSIAERQTTLLTKKPFL